MTRTPYRLLTELNESEVFDVLRHILQLREEEDIPDFTNLSNMLNGGFVYKTMIKNITAAETLSPTLFHADTDATGGVITIKFSASPADGQRHSVAKLDASGNAVTVDGNGKTINGSATRTLSSQYDSEQYIFSSTANEWRVI